MVGDDAHRLYAVRYPRVNSDWIPQFRNLRVCPNVGSCVEGDECFNAHTESQVEAAIKNLEEMYPHYQSTQRRVEAVRNDLYDDGRKRLRRFTHLCNSFIQGVRCRYENDTGSRCHFAHKEATARAAIERCAAAGVCRNFNRSYCEEDLENDLMRTRVPDEPIEPIEPVEQIRDDEANRYPSLNDYFPPLRDESVEEDGAGAGVDHEPPEASRATSDADRTVRGCPQEEPGRPNPLNVAIAAPRLAPVPLLGDKVKTELCPSILRNVACATEAICTYAHSTKEVAAKGMELFTAGAIDLSALGAMCTMQANADKQCQALEQAMRDGNATNSDGIWKQMDSESGIERLELPNGTFKTLVPEKETIWCGRWKNPADQAYCKCVVKKLDPPPAGRDISKELEVLKKFTNTQADEPAQLNHICVLFAFCSLKNDDGLVDFYAAIELCDMTIGQAVTCSSPEAQSTFGRNGPTLPQRVQWCAEMAGGLAAVHERFIMHRDLKPPNVLLKRTGEGDAEKYIVKIADFGSSKIRNPVRRTARSVFFFNHAACSASNQWLLVPRQSHVLRAFRVTTR